MDRIREAGMEIRGIWGEHRVAIERCLISTDALVQAGEKFDLVLLTVKSHGTLEAARAVEPLLTPESLVVSLQNGLGNAEAIAGVVGWERTVAGMVIFGVEHLEAGGVRVTVQADVVRLGNWQGAVDVQRMEAVAALITAAGIETVHEPDIQKCVWNKVFYNCALNPLATVLGSTYGFLLTTEPTREIMRRVIDEAYQVAWALEAQLFHQKPGDYIGHLFENLIPPTAAHHPSMLQDIQKGKRTEIDALNGALVRLGKEHGLTCQTNQTLVDLIHVLEATQPVGRHTPAI